MFQCLRQCLRRICVGSLGVTYYPFNNSPAVLVCGSSSVSEPAVVVDFTSVVGTFRGQDIMAGNYGLPGFIVQMRSTSPLAFPNTQYETLRGEYPLFQNWVVD
jgi:hypothetical protein